MRKLARVLLYLILIVVAVFAWRNFRARQGQPISVTGGESLNILLPDLPVTYLQKDPRWAKEKLGSTSQPFGSVGCAVCSVAMAATRLGFEIDPGRLNEELRQKAGYTPQGWLIWDAISRVSDKRLRAEIADRPTYAGLDKAIKSGAYPVVKFILLTGVPHWVVIVGKEGQEYLIRDPLLDCAKPVPLSKRADAIYSVRFIRQARQ